MGRAGRVASTPGEGSSVALPLTPDHAPDAARPHPGRVDAMCLDIETGRLRWVEDEVDRLVAAWREQRPDLDVEPLEVLSRVHRLARHLDRARRATFAEHGLEGWEFDVLTALRRAGAPYELTPGALLRATLVTSGTMTNRIDRLEQAALVRRRADPRDRRGVLVRITEDGRDRVDATLVDLVERERELLAGLTVEQRRHLAGLLRTLLTPYDT